MHDVSRHDVNDLIHFTASMEDYCYQQEEGDAMGNVVDLIVIDVAHAANAKAKRKFTSRVALVVDEKKKLARLTRCFGLKTSERPHQMD